MIRIPFHQVNIATFLSCAAVIVFLGSAILSPAEAYGQTLTCERLSHITKFTGTVTVKGTGAGEVEGTHYTTRQSVRGSLALNGYGTLGCSKDTWDGSLAAMGSVDDILTTPCTNAPGKSSEAQWKASENVHSISGGSLKFNFQANEYVLKLWAAMNVARRVSDCSARISDGPTGYAIGPAGALPFTVTMPLPGSSWSISGTHQFREMRPHPVDWEITWHLSPTDNVDCPSYRAGSIIACENQALGEDVGIVGTPFSFHYQSDRVSGRADADAPAIAHAKHFAGWTLNAHHAYDVAGNVLYLGNGGRRSGDSFGRIAPTNNGDFLIADENGGLVSVFNSQGQHSETRDALTGNVLYRFDYNSSGQLIAVTDGDANVTKVERTTEGKPTAIVGPFGQRTLLTVDSNGYLASITNPADESVTLSSSSSGLLTSMTDARGNIHHFKYTDDGRLIEDKDPSAHTQTLSRSENTNGHTAKLITAANRTTTYAVENGAKGKRRITTFADGLQSVSDKDFDGKKMATNPSGTKTTTTVKPDPHFGMQSPLTSTTVTMPSGQASTVTRSRIANLTDPADTLSLTELTDTVKVNGRSYTSTYDRAANTFTATTPEGRQTKTILDAKGHVVQDRVAAFLPTHYTYDNHGRLKTISQGTGSDVRTITFDYNNAGYLESITDPLGRMKKLSYDTVGRTTYEVLPDNRIIRYAYDKNSNVTGITPPGRPEHKFAYTPLDLPLAYVPPDIFPGSEETANSYNADRQLKQVLRPDGQTLGASYDPAGRLKSLAYPQNALSYDYHPSTGKLATIAAPGGRGLSFKYDGSLLIEEKWSGPVTGAVSRTYDNDFWISSLSVNGSNPINLQYDNDGLMVKAGNLTIARDAQSGLIKETTLGSLTDKWNYDGYGELKRYSAGGLYTVEHDRDKLGRITETRETIGGATTTYTHEYDFAGRLHKVKKDGATTATYTYDHNGNRASFTSSTGTVTGTYDDQDRLTQYGNTTYTYTANGELLSKTFNGETTTYRYDALGNLTEVELPDGTHVTYLIDGMNRRIAKQVNGTKVQGFLYQDGLRPIAELDGNNNVISRFIYAIRSNVPDYMVKAGVTYRIIVDHLGSPRLVVDTTTGQIVQRTDYDAFGRVMQDTSVL